MSDSPEPGFARSRPQSERQWDMPVGGPVVPREPPPHALSAAVRRRLRLSIMAAAVLFAGLVATFPPSRPTADTAPAAAPPAWNIELMAAGRRPVTALVYGAEAGLHLVRVPAAAAGGAEPRVIPARLGESELYMMSLGWAPLEVRASSPPGTTPMSWSAQARFVQAYQDERGTGVQTSWR